MRTKKNEKQGIIKFLLAKLSYRNVELVVNTEADS